MRTIVSALLVVLALGAGTWVQAETIYLKDGGRLAGKIVGAAGDSIRFESSHGILVINREDIQKIEYEQTLPSTDSAPQVPVEPPTTPTVSKRTIAESVVGQSPNNNSGVIPPTKRKAVVVLGVGYRFASDECEGGPQGSISLFAPVSEAVLVGGGIGFAHFDNKVKTLSKGSVTLIPLTAQLALRSPGGVAFAAGLGYTLASHTLDSEVESAFASFGLGVEEKLKGAITAEASLGFATHISENSKLGVSLGYQFLEPKGEATVTDLATGTYITVKFDTTLSAPFIRAHLEF